jgi:plastocyanin
VASSLTTGMLTSRDSTKGGEQMRLRRIVMFCIVAVLGAAAVILPAIASSETPPTITAYAYAETRYWLPATAQIAEGGTVRFTNPSSEIKHGLEFTGGPAKPSCTGLPAAAGEVTGATSWTAECGFSAPGTYTFICTVHPVAMKGAVTVSAAGVVTTTTTNTGTTGTTTTTTPAPAPAPGEPSLGGVPSGTPRLLTGATSAAFRVAGSQHGRLVRGSLALAPAAVGGSLKLELLARIGGEHGVLAGRLSRSSLSSERLSFAVALNARGKRALQLHGHLALRLRVRVVAKGGAVLTLTRAVTLHGPA